MRARCRVIAPLASTHAATRAAGSQAAEMIAGVSYFREAGVEHDVQNHGATEIVFIETELKA